jgi:hypothetical protein
VEGRTATDVFSHGLTLGGVWGIVSTAGGELQVPWSLGGTHAHPHARTCTHIDRLTGVLMHRHPRTATPALRHRISRRRSLSPPRA